MSVCLVVKEGIISFNWNLNLQIVQRKWQRMSDDAFCRLSLSLSLSLILSHTLSSSLAWPRGNTSLERGHLTVSASPAPSPLALLFLWPRFKNSCYAITFLPSYPMDREVSVQIILIAKCLWLSFYLILWTIEFCMRAPRVWCMPVARVVYH